MAAARRGLTKDTEVLPETSLTPPPKMVDEVDWAWEGDREL